MITVPATVASIGEGGPHESHRLQSVDIQCPIGANYISWSALGYTIIGY